MQQTKVSAQSWILMDADSHVYLRGHNTQDNREFASLTKMYTLYACLLLNKTLRINPCTTVVKIFDTGLGGTLAYLVPNQYINLRDLYYGLMLPSGNDAAYILASYYGCWLLRDPHKTGPLKAFRTQSLSNDASHLKLFGQKFIQFMNRCLVKELLNHKHTKFQNPHGLSNKNQVSNVWELAEASFIFLKDGEFNKISSCQFYSGYYYNSEATFEWENTNLLLREGYSGIKTGITTTAGGCLASLTSIEIKKYQEKRLLIIVLGCQGAKTRFEDTKQIVKSYQNYLKMMKL